eukprot:TRINITY_DN7957_c0_g2_i1.p1 TRINITY_DN7957_c0_g2~~TRINITY_DN7957_c0_g2_i1.p1  ORF type:complete len:825 (+),score=295.15 TRINITY_DN7957_c0_g2_i1:156-2477(+)
MAKVVDVVADAARRGPVVVVASALCGITDDLIRMAHLARDGGDGTRSQGAAFYKMAERHFALCKEKPGCHDIEGRISVLLDEVKAILGGIETLRELSPRTLDLVMSYGEKLSCSVLTFLLKAKGLDAMFVDGRKLIHTNEEHQNAWVDYDKTAAALTGWYAGGAMRNRVPVITGFCGSSPSGETTTLGRGGGDLTASIIGGLLKAECIEVWTDVDGVMTANPRCVDGALVIPTLSYEEAMELSYFGAKVIYAPTMAPAMRAEVPLVIRNTFNPKAPGTFIQRDPKESADYRVRGITSIDGVALLNLQGSDMVGCKGVSGRLFRALEDVNVILISQASSEHSICLAVAETQAARAKTLIDTEFEREIGQRKIDAVDVATGCSIVAIVGCQVRKLFGLAGLVTTCLGEHGINIIALAQGSSELNMSLVVQSSECSKALRLLHRTFFADGLERRMRAAIRSVHLFINSKTPDACMDLLRDRGDDLFKDKNTNVKVVGVCGVKKMRLAPTNNGSLDASLSARGGYAGAPMALARQASTGSSGAGSRSPTDSPSHTADDDANARTAVRCSSMKSLDDLGGDWERDDAECVLRDDAAFVDSALQYADCVADGQRVSVVLIDDSENFPITGRYAELLDNGVGIITSNRTLWDRDGLSEMLLNSRFIWRHASGFPVSSSTAVLACRAVNPTETLKVTLTTSREHKWLLKPLHALAACPCENIASPGSLLSWREAEGGDEAHYTLEIETAYESTTLASKVATSKPELPVLIKELFLGGGVLN